MHAEQLVRALGSSHLTAMALGRARHVGARIGVGMLGALSYGAAYARGLRMAREWRRLAATNRRPHDSRAA